MPSEVVFGFLFESLLDERAVQQIHECAPLLRELLDASAEKRSAQWAILKGATGLVTTPKHKLLMQTPEVLMALYACPRDPEATSLAHPAHPAARHVADERDLLSPTPPTAAQVRHRPPRDCRGRRMARTGAQPARGRCGRDGP